MSHLCTDIDLLYKSATSKTDNEDDASNSEDYSTRSDIVGDSLLNDILDWNMHDVFNIDCMASSATSVSSQYCYEKFKKTKFDSVVYNKYCKCCKKKIKIQSSYGNTQKTNKNHMIYSKKPCSSSHAGQRSYLKRKVFKNRSNSNKNQSFNKANINCSTFYNLEYVQKRKLF
jgi:hypothetical protein